MATVIETPPTREAILEQALSRRIGGAGWQVNPSIEWQVHPAYYAEVVKGATALANRMSAGYGYTFTVAETQQALTARGYTPSQEQVRADYPTPDIPPALLPGVSPVEPPIRSVILPGPIPAVPPTSPRPGIQPLPIVPVERQPVTVFAQEQTALSRSLPLIVAGVLLALYAV